MARLFSKSGSKAAIGRMRILQLLVALGCLTILMTWSTAATAQTTYPVQVNTHLLPPYSLYLSDYYSTREKLTITLINRDQQKPVLNVRLKVVISAQGGVRLETNPNNYIKPIELENGAPLRLTLDDLAPYFQPSNLIAQGYLAGGKLPEGYVQFCVQAFEAFTNQPLSLSSCAQAWITSQKPPLLSLPANNESVIFREPLNIMFQWTPRHQGLTYVEYEFILKELWDNGMTPQAAFQYSPEIYKETVRSTSFVYGAFQPPLLPGKRYAWAVRAQAREGVDEVNQFQNDGYSEVRTFIVQDNCAPPEFVMATAERKRLNVEWTPFPEHIGFTVSYREVTAGTSSSPSAWANLETQQPKAILYGLKNGAKYEYRVASFCMAGQPVFSPIFSLTLPKEDSARLAQCGIMPEINLSNREPIRELKTGDVIKASDYPVTITRVSGGNGVFTGEGWTIIPWLNDAKIAVQFTSITVNTDKQMIAGYIDARYDKNEGQIADLDDIWEGGFDVGQVKTGITKIDHKFDFSIPGVEAFSLNDEGELVITDNEGTPHTINQKYLENTGNDGNKVVVFPMTVEDKDGKVYQVEKVEEKDLYGNVTSTRVVATEVGKAGQPLSPDSFDPTQLDGSKAIVRFSKGDGYYAFDEWKPYYGYVSLIRDKYEKLFTDYYAPWKFMATGKTDIVYAIIDVKDKDIDPKKVIFKTPKGTEFRILEYNEAEKKYKLQLVAGPGGDVQEIYALHPRTTDTYWNLGKLSVASYQPQTFKVVLVSVKNAVIDAGIEQKLKEIYGPAGVTWEVVRDTFDYDNVRLMESGSTGLSTYNEAMRQLNNSYKAARINKFDSRANYMFFLLATGAEKINDREATGFMPRGSQFGYIFTSETKDVAEPVTVAHELGHGRFKFFHTFDKHYGDVNGSRTTDNLMDYNNGDALAKWQWDQVHDPAWVVSVFEGDERSLMQLDPIVALIQKRVAELEKQTKQKHFTIIHCDACENAGANITNEVVVTDTKQVPSDEPFSELSKLTVPDTKLTQVQFIERKGGKCIVLYYAHTKGEILLGLPETIAASFAGTPSKKLYFISASRFTNCTSFADDLSNTICDIKPDAAFKTSEQTLSYYTTLFNTIKTCLLSTPKDGKILAESEIEKLLKRAKAEVRSNQDVEFEQNGSVYRLDQNGKAVLLENALSNEAINAGGWDDATIDNKMRLGYNAEGILQFKALGIRKDLPIFDGKTADLPVIAANMREKNNAMFMKGKITQLETTAKVNRVIVNSDEFPDRKKVQVDENASYFKLFSELGGVGISFLKTGKIEQPVYNEGEVYTIKAPPIATGVLESVGMVVTDVTSAVCMVHDLATDEKARKEAIQGFVQVKDQVSDDPTQLFPILQEVVIEEFTGSTPEEFGELTSPTTNEGRKQHITAKTGVRTASNVFASGNFLVRLPEMSEKVAFRMARSKSFLKFKKLPNVQAEALEKFKTALKDMPDGGEKFLDDFKDASDDIRRNFSTTRTNWITGESWMNLVLT